MNETFLALQKEALFTKEVLGAGATQIRKANYANKGIYFQAFTSLATGLERIGKLCLMLDYYASNGGSFPDFKYLKNEIGHDIELLYERSLEVAARRGVKFYFLKNLEGEIHKEILKVLSAFAKGDRYSNINLLVNSKQQGDPVASWVESVDLPLFQKRVSERKKETIAHNARAMAELTGGLIHVQHTSETGQEITDVEQGSLLTGIQQAVAPYRQLYVIHIIRFWSELLRSIQYTAMELGKPDIPFFSEIIAPFVNNDSYIRTRKTWDTL
nr:hypothetical protein [Halomonas sp. 1513]